MNNEMLKNRSFEEYVSFMKEGLLKSYIPFSPLTYGEYFEDKASKEAHIRLEDRDGKYFKAIKNVSLFPNYVGEIIKQRRGDQQSYYEKLVQYGYIDESITYNEYLRISGGGSSDHNAKVIEASLKLEEDIKYVSSDDMCRFLFEKISRAVLGDYINYLWRSC